MPITNVLPTDQEKCFDALGAEIPCAGSGQDGELGIGIKGPNPRFTERAPGLVQDGLTGLVWPKKGVSFEFALRWEEALEHIRDLNREGFLGCSDWRLPNRRELRSLISHGRSRPALPLEHPFTGVEQTWYWTSTSSAMYPAYAWAVHLAGGRMFWNRKDQISMVWPVRGESPILPWTGQNACFDSEGARLECPGTGQDGELRQGVSWPRPRFEKTGEDILDRLTGLTWREVISRDPGLLTWPEALQAVAELEEKTGTDWHLPNINELESLVDASRSSPALPEGGHPFLSNPEVLWSSTSSGFEPDWAYGLYMHKGAVGVGYKKTARFGVWVARGQKTEDRRQRSEVRGQRSQVRSQRSEVRGQRTEGRGLKSEGRGQKRGVRGQKAEAGARQGTERRFLHEDTGQKVSPSIDGKLQKSIGYGEEP
jgi:hypothetical protein